MHKIFNINLLTRLTVLNHPSCLNKLLTVTWSRRTDVTNFSMKTTHTYPYHVFQTNLLGSSCRSVVPRSPGHVLSLGFGRTTRMRAKRPKACGTGRELATQHLLEVHLHGFSWSLLSLASKERGLRGGRTHHPTHPKSHLRLFEMQRLSCHFRLPQLFIKAFRLGRENMRCFMSWMSTHTIYVWFILPTFLININQT